MLKCLFSIAVFVAVASPISAGDFDNNAPSLLKEAKARAKEAPEGQEAAPAQGGKVWVSFDPADIGADFPLQTPVAQSGTAAVYQVDESALFGLSAFMHKKFNRCAGFFAHRSRADAEKDLLAPPAAAAAEAYTLDQQAWTKPLIPRVKESEIRSTIDALAAFSNRYYTSDTGVGAARWLQGRWQALAGKLPGASTQLVVHSGWKQPSVVLTIPGSEKPDEIVVLGGHLDSINMGGWGGGGDSRAPGADDNASGIAVLTEAVRVLSEAGFRPKRTVQFMGYAAEEEGLMGSQEIAKKYASSGKKVVAVIQYDMTNFQGSGPGMFFLSDNVNPELTAFLGKLTDAYIGAAWAATRCGYACSDHASWTKSGFPASAAFESTMRDMNQHLHTEGDTLGNSGGSAEHSVNFAKLAVAFAAEIAKANNGIRLAGGR